MFPARGCRELGGFADRGNYERFAKSSGREIEKDAKGEPTGMLKEGAAMRLVESKIPAPTEEQRRHGIELALGDMCEKRRDVGAGQLAWEDFLTYRALKNEGKLTVRVTEWLPFAAPLEKLKQMRRDGGTTDPWLRTGALKMVTDGALGRAPRRCWLLIPTTRKPAAS
jgi:predicted amidohydrolase YtcJ